MPKVIVNSTPIISLGKIERLELLRKRFGEIIIPQAVFREVTAKNDAIRDMLLKNASWIHVLPVTNPESRKMYKAKLHDGEVEVMMLAQELHADLVVIDDGPARKTAEYLGLNITGTLGVLIKCKQTGEIPSVLPLLRELTKNGIYLKPSLIASIQKNVDE